MLELVIAPWADVQVIGSDRWLASVAGNTDIVVVRDPADKAAFLDFVANLGASTLLPSHGGVIRAHKSLAMSTELRLVGWKRTSLDRDSFYLYRGVSDLSMHIASGWNPILRTFQIYPVNRDFDDLQMSQPRPAGVRELLASAPFLISCGDDGDNMAHIVPLSASLDGALSSIEDAALTSAIEVTHVEGNWFPPTQTA